MFPSHYMDMSGGWWFLPMIGFFIFMMLACFLFRRVFHGGAFCCAGGVGSKKTASDDPVGILKSRYAKAEANGGYEVVRIGKTRNSCRLCEDYAERQKSKPVAVMSCEGACLRGEVARRAANILCHSLAPEKTARICLGSAFTKDTGQRALVRNAPRVIALEGCVINCSSRMMSGAVEGLSPEVINADRLYDFDRKLFGIEEMPSDQIDAHARTVARKIADSL